ncbi:MAG TPA: hypothetical protein VK960_02535 [Acidimicrobiia bacterium]|nr:hypothetical protein [Acidimicrobiia bacterium]
MHIAARAMDSADPGAIFVSGTMKDLVVGAGIAFDAVGMVELRGVPGEWAWPSSR